MTTNRSCRSGGPFEPSPSGSQLFFFSVLALSFPSFFFFYPSPPAPLSPEISFQHTKPCKNRPRVFKLRPVCKDVPACYAASGYCCSGAPCLILSSLCTLFLQRTKLTNEESDMMRARREGCKQVLLL